MDILVIDVGGSSVKLWHKSSDDVRKFASGPTLSPGDMVREALALTRDWPIEAVALGVPCRVEHGKPIEDPENLGPGWVSFDFAAALGKPVRIMNDAALQALGSYEGGRMVFFGMGHAVGSAFVAQPLIVSLDLGWITIDKRHLWELMSDKGIEKLGIKEVEDLIHEVLPMLKRAMLADYVVLGGGSAKRLKVLPVGVRRGHNGAVLEGGRRLWEELPDPADTSDTKWIIR